MDEFKTSLEEMEEVDQAVVREFHELKTAIEELEARLKAAEAEPTPAPVSAPASDSAEAIAALGTTLDQHGAALSLLETRLRIEMRVTRTLIASLMSKTDVAQGKLMALAIQTAEELDQALGPRTVKAGEDRAEQDRHHQQVVARETERGMPVPVPAPERNRETEIER